MLDIDEINNTISELENGDTTFVNCQKLASLYVVRYNLQKSKLDTKSSEIDTTENELQDILPQYRMYVAVKRKYQLNELPRESVLLSMRDVCKEIHEFIKTLYQGTDMQEEREKLHDMVQDLLTIF